MRYVVGFAFDFVTKRVLLIQKLKPEWQAGHLNGVGGKIEKGESVHGAMAREFYEETGAIIPWEKWRRFCTLTARDGTVDFFSVDIEDVKVRQMETEKLVWIYYNYLPGYVIDNLRWLIPMALAKVPVHGTLTEG